MTRAGGLFVAVGVLGLVAPSLAQPAAGPRLLDRIYFDFASAELGAVGRDTAATVARLAADAPECQLRVTGRADPRGCEWCNRRLSERRARAVLDDLVRAGVAADRIEIVALGEQLSDDEPTTDDLTEDERRARQRRVDVYMSCPPREPRGGVDGG